MAEPKFPVLLKALKFLFRIARVSAMVAAPFYLLGVFWEPAFIVSMAALALSAAGLLIASGIILICYSQYSLQSLLIWFLAINAFIVCALSGQPQFVAVGICGLLTVAAIAVCLVIAFAPPLETVQSKYMKSPAGGKVKCILVRAGDKVIAGQKLLILDDRNLERVVEAEFDATIERIQVYTDQWVSAGMVLGVIKAV